MQGNLQASGGKLNPEQWVELYGDQLYRYAMLRLRNTVDAEEAVQQTFLAALQNQDQYSGAGSEGAWLLGILRRKVIDVARRRLREMPVETEVPEWDPYFDTTGQWRPSWAALMRQPLDELERAEFWRIFRECLEGLPPRHATAFSLRVLEDQASAAVCEQMGISLSNLWVMLHRARLQLATCCRPAVKPTTPSLRQGATTVDIGSRT